MSAGRRAAPVALARDVLAARLLGRRRPVALSWEVTALCNATCRYCAFREAAPDELDTGEALRLVDDMRACGTRMLALTGGEPLTRKDLPRIVRALHRSSFELSLNTNGVLVPRRESIVRAMHRVQISVDGPEAVHDAVRGAGSWRRAVQAIEACQRWGVPVQVQAVLTRTSLPRLEELIRWCTAIDVPLQIQPADAHVLETDEPNPEAPDPAALSRALRELLRSRPRVLLNPATVLDHMLRWPTPTPMPCASGAITARITSAGMLRLCGRPPSTAPEASWRELGLAGAFRHLEAVPCSQCWCAPRIQVNHAYRGRGLWSIATERLGWPRPSVDRGQAVDREQAVVREQAE